MLYRDLGVNSRRKGNPVAEVCGLYKPQDFQGVVSEWLRSRGVVGTNGKSGKA
jgi:dimethylaniline monooxygenase (N-oxide forming)